MQRHSMTSLLRFVEWQELLATSKLVLLELTLCSDLGSRATLKNVDHNQPNLLSRDRLDLNAYGKDDITLDISALSHILQ